MVKKPIGMRLTEIEGQGIYVSKIGFMAFYYSVYLLHWYKSTNADAARLTEIEGQGIYVSEIGFTTQFMCFTNTNVQILTLKSLH